ncbi:MAG: type II secretion system protein [Arenicellales bacterium]
MRVAETWRQRGVTLIELAVILVIVGLMLVVAIAVMPRLTERSRLNTTKDVTIYDVRQALISFAATNGRLPCPDTNGNGLEGGASGCTTNDVVGRVPYRALGFSDPVLDTAHLPLRYAVYRNQNGGGAGDADLAVLPNRFIPVLPGQPPVQLDPFPTSDQLCSGTDPNTFPNYPDTNPDLSQGLTSDLSMPDNQNDLDFCLALRNAKAAAASTGYVYTLDLNGRTPSFNDAFVLASGGVEDADGSGGDIAFDGLNDLSNGGGIGYESPARRRNSSPVVSKAYDDIVYAMPFDLLEAKLACGAITVGVSSAANISIASAEMLVQAEDVAWLAYRARVMDRLSNAQAALGLTLAILQEITTITDAVKDALNAPCATVEPDEAPSAAEAAIEAVVAAVDIGLEIANLAKAASQIQLDNDACTQAVSDVDVILDMTDRIYTSAVNADQRGGQGNAPPSQPPPADRVPTP